MLCVKNFKQDRNIKLHHISSQGNYHYYYEVSANLVLKTDSIGTCIFRKFDPSKNYRSLPYSQSRQLQNALKEIIYLCERLKNLNFVTPHDTMSNFLYNVEGIRIIPISQCNMACRYCLQKFNNQIISENLASKIINFIKNSILSSRVHIKFYGGEPFLNFAVIEYIVEKIKALVGGRTSFTFSANTNGTIINDKILNFLIKHKFYLAISLDGPPSIHNKNRLLRSGRGSFEVVFSNVKRIQDKNENYFNNYVFIQPTIPPQSYKIYESVMEFFSKNKFRNISISWLINNTATPLISNKIVLDIISNIKSHNYECIPAVDILRCLDVLRLDKSAPKMKSCGAGTKRFAISALGEIYPCEQLIDDKNYCIGNVETGVNFNNLRKIWTSVYTGFKNCSKCWAMRFCPYYCIALQPFSKKNCLRQKNRVKQIIELYIALAEYDPTCYSDFLSYIHGSSKSKIEGTLKDELFE